MSRIGKKPVAVPSGVKVDHDPSSRTVSVEGPKGRMSYSYRPEIDVAWEEGENQLVCTIPEKKSEDRQVRAHWGTTRSRIQGMVTGVTEGFTKKLEVIGVGWNARVQGNNLQLNVGYCHPIDMPIPVGVECTVEGNVITVSGYDKQVVGQFASVIRQQRLPEPYNGKGIKYVEEIIIRKQGKAFGA